MTRIEAVILDWAGTTVDFGSFAPVQAFIEAFREFGIELLVSEVREPMGMRKKDHIRTIMSMERVKTLWIARHGKLWSEEDLDKVYEQSERKVFEVLGDYATPKPYTLDVIAELREKGFKIGSTTGYTDEMMQILAPKSKELGFEPDAWVTSTSTRFLGRPYPYMLFKNMELLKISSVRNVIKVGDTTSDIKEAKNAGVISVGVLDGSSEMGLTEEEYNKLSESDKAERRAKVEAVYVREGADYVINDLRGLLPIIEQIS